MGYPGRIAGDHPSSIRFGEEKLKVEVDLPSRAYSIIISRDLFRDGARELEDLLGDSPRALVLTDRNVSRLWYPLVERRLREMGPEVSRFVIPGREADKTIETVTRCYEAMGRSGFDRDSAVVALGGGVVGDIAGFVASTYMRGIRLVQVPTTLLAMVDSSIGGKNGVNFPWGKNMVGTFYQPSIVLIDPVFLESLPEEVFRDGVAEIIKYGVIGGGDLVSIVEGRMRSSPSGEDDCLEEVVSRCCRIKADLVVRDEFDRGVRALLNFGHTIGHALEAAGSYARYSHGQALSIGMRGAFRISRHLGLAARDEERRLEDLLDRFGLPLTWNIAGTTCDDVWQYLERDKKARGGRLDFVLTKGFGSVIIRDISADKGLILKVLDELRE